MPLLQRARMASRLDLIRQRREARLHALDKSFGEPVRPRPCASAAPFTRARCETPTFTERFLPSRVFRDPDPPLGSLPRCILADRARVASADPTSRQIKLQSVGRSRFLSERATDKIRPNSGTLGEGAAMYSSFAPDRCFHLTPVPGLGRSRSATPSMGGTQVSMSRTLIR